jgi:hypothetical protein
MLRGAIALAAVLVAVVVAVVVADGVGGSPAKRFSRDDLASLVLNANEAPGNLHYGKGESGPGLGQYLPDLSVKPQASYHTVFRATSEDSDPYRYSESDAAVFENEDAAQDALDRLKRVSLGPNFENKSAHGLGDEGFGAFYTTGEQPGPEYHYAWRTANLLQVFSLSLSGPGVSDARGFADKMASRSGS